MRTLIVALILVLASTFAMCENKIGTVWFAEKENGRDWCAYSDEEIFKMDIHGGAPDNSPRGVFANEKLTELFYQTQTASGDWTVLDHYDLRAKSILLTRTIYLTADRLKVIETAHISDNVVSAFKVESIVSFEGVPKRGDGVDYPSVPINASPSKFQFMHLLGGLKHARKSCD